MSAQILDFNRGVALDRVGGDEALLQEVIDLFLDEYPHLVAEVEQAVAESDPKLLERAAHSLKGSLSTIGAEAAADEALRLEMMGRMGGLEGAREGLSNLHAAITRLCRKLGALKQF
jgi:two-component system sensor histidine kinase/response regulator